MKNNNSELKEIFEENNSIREELKLLDDRKKKLEERKKEFIKSYFKNYGIELTRHTNLPTSHNVFISSPDFYLKKSEEGKIFWVASGRRITVKNGDYTYGTATDELWQGQWESLPEGIRNLTLEEATEKSKSVFPPSPSVIHGIDFSAPAMVLHEDPNNGWQLLWRKAGSAYLGRFSGSASANSGLQLMYGITDIAIRKEERAAWEDIKDKVAEATGKDVHYSTRYINLTEGGRLSVGLIEKESKKIDTIFGAGTADSIIEKMKIQNENKAEIRKQLKGVPKKDKKEKKKEEPKQFTIPKKIKL